jgi:hypothetical protein
MWSNNLEPTELGGAGGEIGGEVTLSPSRRLAGTRYKPRAGPGFTTGGGGNWQPSGPSRAWTPPRNGVGAGAGHPCSGAACIVHAHKELATSTRRPGRRNTTQLPLQLSSINRRRAKQARTSCWHRDWPPPADA